MDIEKTYGSLIKVLVEQFGEKLKTIVLFGSQSRAEANLNSDHDVFVVVEDLANDPLERQREVMTPLLPYLLDIPEKISIIAKTPHELLENLTPLIIDVCMDGIGLYGKDYFAGLQKRVSQSLHDAGLQRRRLAGTWMWVFPTLPVKEWELDWEGYREPV